MMNKKLFILFSLFLILFISNVAAAPPAQGNVNINLGLEIEFTKLSFIENGEHHLFNSHVINISNGLRVDNTTTNCSFHLFDNRGFHLINQQPMIYDNVGLDWEYNVTGGNFTRNGEYSYLIVCNTTDFGGFESVGITVTPTGETLDTAQSVAVVGLLLVLITMACIFLYLGVKADYLPFKIFLIALGILFLVVLIGVSVNMIKELMVLGAVFSGTIVNLYRLMLILVSIGGLGLILYIIVMSLKQFYKNRGLVDDDED